LAVPLTPKSIIGQMMVAGFEGTSLNARLEHLVAEREIGGLILFERNFQNPDQLAQLTGEIQSLACAAGAPGPVFVSVDQEGGRVSRLKSPFTAFPSQCCLGRARSEELARAFGKALGEEMAAVGVNVVYAPVLDVNSNPLNPIIGARAISEDPDWTARLGGAVIEGLRDAGVAPVGKHFPGHGDTSVDSHLDLPTVGRDADSLGRIELPPFQEGIRHGLEIIMPAHVNYPAWDSKFPATFSRPILQGILRERMGFNGIVISDDLEMKAIADHFPFDSVGPMGLAAGIDLFLICHDNEKILRFHDGMVRRLEDGSLDRSLAQQAVERILRVKAGIPKRETDPGRLAALRETHQTLARKMQAYMV